jgi:hypothetical protein
MRVSRSIVLNHPPNVVFDVVSDPQSYPEFFQGVTRWKPLSNAVGVGARYRVLMRVGSIEAGGTVRVCEWTEPSTIAWESEAGIRQRGRWTLAAHGGSADGRGSSRRDAGTRLTLDIEYALSGGPAGWLVERMSSRIVGRNAWATLLATRRLLDSGRVGSNASDGRHTTHST